MPSFSPVWPMVWLCALVGTFDVVDPILSRGDDTCVAERTRLKERALGILWSFPQSLCGNIARFCPRPSATLTSCQRYTFLSPGRSTLNTSGVEYITSSFRKLIPVSSSRHCIAIFGRRQLGRCKRCGPRTGIQQASLARRIRSLCAT